MRVACYYRVSKDRKGGVSIDVQRETCERYVAQQSGWIITATYIDDGKSAYTDDVTKRPAFQRLLSDARARQFEVVLIYKYDRFARKMRFYLQCIEDLKRYGADVKSATESDEWLSVGISGIMAEQYSRMLSARLTDVRRWEVTQQGLHVGHVPVGYTRQHGILTPSVDADAVRELGRLYATGHYSAVRLAEQLNADGYTMPGGLPWKASGIKETVRCPVYAGFVTYKGGVFPGVHPPLWDAALWARIQEVNAQRTYTRSPESPHHALLTALVRCAQCGHPMSHSPIQRNPELRYYRCQASARRMLSPVGLTCRARCAYAGAVEAVTLGWLSGLALIPSLLDQARARLVAPPRQSGPSRADVEDRLRRLARAYADGGYTDEEYTARRADLLGQLEHAAPTAPPLDIEAGVALLTDLPALLDEALPEERQQIVRQLVSAVYVYRRDVLAIRPTRATEVFFQAADPVEWLTIVQNAVRRGSNAKSHYSLKHPPIVLAAA